MYLSVCQHACISILIVPFSFSPIRQTCVILAMVYSIEVYPIKDPINSTCHFVFASVIPIVTIVRTKRKIVESTWKWNRKMSYIWGTPTRSNKWINKKNDEEKQNKTKQNKLL